MHRSLVVRAPFHPLINNSQQIAFSSDHRISLQTPRGTFGDVQGNQTSHPCGINPILPPRSWQRTSSASAQRRCWSKHEFWDKLVKLTAPINNVTNTLGATEGIIIYCLRLAIGKPQAPSHSFANMTLRLFFPGNSEGPSGGSVDVISDWRPISIPSVDVGHVKSAVTDTDAAFASTSINVTSPSEPTGVSFAGTRIRGTSSLVCSSDPPGFRKVGFYKQVVERHGSCSADQEVAYRDKLSHPRLFGPIARYLFRLVLQHRASRDHHFFHSGLDRKRLH